MDWGENSGDIMEMKTKMILKVVNYIFGGCFCLYNTLKTSDMLADIANHSEKISDKLNKVEYNCNGSNDGFAYKLKS